MLFIWSILHISEQEHWWIFKGFVNPLSSMKSKAITLLSHNWWMLQSLEQQNNLPNFHWLKPTNVGGDSRLLLENTVCSKVYNNRIFFQFLLTELTKCWKGFKIVALNSSFLCMFEENSSLYTMIRLSQFLLKLPKFEHFFQKGSRIREERLWKPTLLKSTFRIYYQYQNIVIQNQGSRLESCSICDLVPCTHRQIILSTYLFSKISLKG